MDRRTFVKAGILSALDLGASAFLNRGRCRLLAAPRIEISTEAIDLVGEATVIDMLGLLTLDWLDLFRWQWDPRTFRRSPLPPPRVPRHRHLPSGCRPPRARRQRGNP